jgi:uncharacterized protein
MSKPVSDVAFTAAVKAEQIRRGSRAQYERMEQGKGWTSVITLELATFLGNVQSFYLGTTNADGQPYIQHRGGPSGFLNVLDDQTLGFADFAGNRQYITAGNLAENERAFIFIMDYAHRIRVKIWGRARIVENDEELLSRLRPAVGSITAERTILFSVDAWDRNCHQHIPQLFSIEHSEKAMAPLRKRIADLEQELEQLRSGASR